MSKNKNKKKKESLRNEEKAIARFEEVINGRCKRKATLWIKT